MVYSTKKEWENGHSHFEKKSFKAAKAAISFSAEENRNPTPSQVLRQTTPARGLLPQQEIRTRIDNFKKTTPEGKRGEKFTYRK